MDRKKTGADSDRNRMGRIKNKCARYKTYSPFFLLRIFVHNMQMLWNARKENTQMYRPLRPLQVCFELTGGMGDYVIAANYLYYFAKYHGLKDECITLYFPHGYGLAKSIFAPSGGLRMREGRQYRHPGTYDVYIRLSRFPAVVFFREHRIRLLCPKMLGYIGMCREFELRHPYFFRYMPFCDGQGAAYCEIMGQKRIQQPDIGRFFRMGERHRWPVHLIEEEYAYLSSLHLSSGQFVTIHHGCDAAYADSTKLWPLQYWKQLVQLLRQKYPKLVIVQIGISKQLFPKAGDVSLYLVGKTSMEQVKVLLKHSYAHIDNEGGLVHLRHALCAGRSFVLFGPTSRQFYGYCENVNLRSKVCRRSCEWLCADWSGRCMKSGGKDAECMKALRPELVMERVSQFLDADRKNGCHDS